MAFGLGVLRLSPAAFWSMTFREVAAAMRGMFPETPSGIGSSELREMMRRYPDA